MQKKFDLYFFEKDVLKSLYINLKNKMDEGANFILVVLALLIISVPASLFK